MKKTIQDYKKESTLNKTLRYPEGIMTRRDYMNFWRVRGAKVIEGTKAQIEYSRTKYNRLSGQEQDEYERKCNTKVRAYFIYFPGNTSMEITAAEFEYFNNMELAEDINTQKMELANKIEAGTATPEEIESDELTEIEYFNKYAK